MTYASSGLIQANDYNALASTFRGQWGTGTVNHGLGQSVSAVANVTIGNQVTAAQWTGLISGLNLCLAHQGQAQISPPSVTAGNPVTHYSAITTACTTVNNASGSTGLALVDGAVHPATYVAEWGTTGNRGLEFTHTVTFASGDAARYFFNAGGKLKLTFSKSGGTATTRNTEWAELASQCGSVQFGWNTVSKVGGGGAVPTIPGASGYWNLTSTPVFFFSQGDSGGSYSTNYIVSYASWSGTASNGGSPVITITSFWVNAWANLYQDIVDGTTTTNLVVSSPSTTYLANTWGTPAVTTSSALY